MPDSALHRFLISFCLPVCFLTMIACEKEEVDMYECNGITPTYTADIKPILDASCAKSGCHNAATAEKGINLSDYANASDISREDRFLGAIQHKKGYDKMPDDAPMLPESQVQLLTCWVQNGSPQ
jgi:hypothetical protein